MRRLATVLLAVLGGCLSGCASQEMANALRGMGQAVADTTERLEAQGIDYRVEAQFPTELACNWTPFGFKCEVQQGFIHVMIQRGRGLGPRPIGTDIPDQAAPLTDGTRGGAAVDMLLSPPASEAPGPLDEVSGASAFAIRFAPDRKVTEQLICTGAGDTVTCDLVATVLPSGSQTVQCTSFTVGPKFPAAPVTVTSPFKMQRMDFGRVNLDALFYSMTPIVVAESGTIMATYTYADPGDGSLPTLEKAPWNNPAIRGPNFTYWPVFFLPSAWSSEP